MSMITNDELESLGSRLLIALERRKPFDEEFLYRVERYIEATMSKMNRKKQFSEWLDQFANSDVAIKCNDNNGKR